MAEIFMLTPMIMNCIGSLVAWAAPGYHELDLLVIDTRC